ncbi:glycoside hydrolase family 32 protein [Brachybacterium saurashtrense]|uniref:Glycoside hydrolase family 32 protein n=1 Tax=Brachybacterium saurashtrense TaxID=556288 RepID=A0A345YT00_9MICO|nr:glycoside hydrolase family 32 protein [Brachybacterium saurashtrense]AXK47052.1 glycoside hydrolase family 32 protein [Brachybacterium saurashtrense]RRR20901.1 glycoside hydrolase family 32 protein [Brachybacterium saurashtrense]
MTAVPRRRVLRSAAQGAAAAPLALAMSSCLGIEPSPEEQAAPARGEGTAGTAAPESHRPRFHLTPPSGWLGDPQRPLVRGDAVHLYGLHHAEGTAPGPTTWAHWTSTDLVTFTPRGTALAGADGVDVWTGSVVVDEGNTAGRGAGAVVALVTRPTDGRSALQEQYLAASEDAATFALEPDPVLRSPEGRTARSEEEIAQASWFRDPKLQRDEERDQWVCALGRDRRVSFWTSPDLRSWEHRSDLVPAELTPDGPDLGGVECPDLFTLTADDGSAHWVLGASLDGSGAGEPTNYAYWVGTWDGERFLPEDPAPRWLDRGWDWYAAVTWPAAEDPAHVRHAIGWMNNWAYARDPSATAESDGYDGQYSVVREVRLVRDDDGALTLVSTPVPALASAATSAQELDDQQVSSQEDADGGVEGTAELGALGPAFALEMDVDWADAEGAALTVVGSADGARGTRISLGDGALHVDRRGSALTAGDTHDGGEGETGDGGGGDTAGRGGSDPFAGLTVARAPIDPGARSAHLHVLVDTQSVEVFLDDGRTALSLTVHPAPGEEHVRLHALGGTARLTGVRLRQH